MTINFALTCTSRFGEGVRKFRKLVEVLERKKAQHSRQREEFSGDF
jgi:hypothetical protein